MQEILGRATPARNSKISRCAFYFCETNEFDNSPSKAAAAYFPSRYRHNDYRICCDQISTNCWTKAETARVAVATRRDWSNGLIMSILKTNARHLGYVPTKKSPWPTHWWLSVPLVYVSLLYKYKHTGRKRTRWRSNGCGTKKRPLESGTLIMCTSDVY